MKLVNLGCGESLHPDWINIDVHPSSAAVLQFDLLQGLPFENASVDVVYASHFLEHFTKAQGEVLAREIYRVLKPSGITRIVVPDLEQSARNYVDGVAKLRLTNDLKDRENHQWAIIELVDQMVRQESGGEMERYCQQMDLVNEDHIAARIGPAFSLRRQKFLRTREHPQQPPARKNLGRRHSLRLKLLALFGIKEEEFEYLMFRRAGELHKWMYDELSLTRLLQSSGFVEVQRTDFSTSTIPDWEKYKVLDVQDAAARKPDSLFMEARK